MLHNNINEKNTQQIKHLTEIKMNTKYKKKSKKKFDNKTILNK